MIPVTGAVTSGTTLGPFIPKSEKYTPLTATLAFCKEKAKDIAKSGSYLAFWATKAIPSLPPNVTKFNTTLRDFKNFIGATEIPEKLHTWNGSVNDLLFKKMAGKISGSSSWGEVGTSARKVFKDTMSLTNSCADYIEFTHLFYPLSKEALKWVSGINFVATLGNAGTGAMEQVQEIKKMGVNTKKFVFHMINIARDVSYFVLGVIGLGFLLTATPVVPWMIVACLTSGLTWTIGSYFYEKMYDPENKGKNLNPAIVIENITNKKKHEQRLAQAAAATV